MDRSTPFKILIGYLDNLRFHQLIILDQLQSEKYFNDCRNHLFTYCYWREFIGFKNYITLELSKYSPPKDEKLIKREIKGIYFTKNFAPLRNNSFANLECLTKIKTIIELITNGLIANKDYYIQELKNKNTAFWEFPDYTFSFNKIPPFISTLAT